MRLIDADALMERLEEEQRIHVGHAAYQGGLAGAGILIAEAPTVKPEGWISTTERQPDRKGVYLVHLSDGRLKIMGYSENLMDLEPRNFCEPAPGWYMQDATFGIFSVANVTHWMPLPEPPEDGEHETGTLS